jgi:hypothetical protein
MFATRYENYTFREPEMVLAYAYLSTTYIVIFFIISLFEKKSFNQYTSLESISMPKLKNSMNIFAGLSILFFILYIQASGGFAYWLGNLDRAFLTREGSGIYYLPFVLFLALYSFLLGVYVKIKKKPFYLFLLFLLFLMLSPFIGSKSRVVMLLFLSFLPSLINAKANFKSILFVVVVFLLFFVLGNYYRNASWMSLSDLLPYMLNYFDTYSALVLGIKDIDSNLFQTTFLPFNKFSSLTGFSGQYYDMSSWLTSIYYPEADKIRATVQWPIEMDLYLNFYYFLGLPIIMLIFFLIVQVEKKAYQMKIGYLFVYGYLFFYTLSHLRGGILLWTDFYLLPFFVISYYLMKRIEKKRRVK